MKVESNWLVSRLFWARASNSCLMRADFSCSSWVIRWLLSVTSCRTNKKPLLIRSWLRATERSPWKSLNFLPCAKSRRKGAQANLHCSFTLVRSRFCSFSILMVCWGPASGGEDTATHSGLFTAAGQDFGGWKRRGEESQLYLSHKPKRLTQGSAS